jgi:hypothetical protein
MKCVTLEEGRVILQDIHAEACRSYVGAKSLMDKMYQQGFFWPTVVSNADSIVHRREGCKFFACQKHVSSHQLQTIPITWPFSTWRLDLVGPFKKAKGRFTHIFVAADKFTKWVKVKPAASITAAKVVEFIREIMYMFAVPITLLLIMRLSLL